MSRSPAGAAVAPEVAGRVPAPDVGLAVVVPGAAELMRVLVAPAGVAGVAGTLVLTPGTGAPAGTPAPGIASHRLLECRTRESCSISNQQSTQLGQQTVLRPARDGCAESQGGTPGAVPVEGVMAAGAGVEPGAVLPVAGLPGAAEVAGLPGAAVLAGTPAAAVVAPGAVVGAGSCCTGPPGTDCWTLGAGEVV